MIDLLEYADWAAFGWALSLGVLFHIAFVQFDSKLAAAIITTSQFVAAFIVAVMKPDLVGYVLVTRVSDFLANALINYVRRSISDEAATTRSSKRAEKWEGLKN